MDVMVAAVMATEEPMILAKTSRRVGGEDTDVACREVEDDDDDDVTR